MVSILAIVETNGEQEPAPALRWEKWLNRKGLWDRERCSPNATTCPYRGPPIAAAATQMNVLKPITRFYAHTDGK